MENYGVNGCKWDFGALIFFWDKTKRSLCAQAWVRIPVAAATWIEVLNVKYARSCPWKACRYALG